MGIYCDFNTAAPQRNGHYKPLEEKEHLKAQLSLNIRSCLSYLLPRGTFRGDKFYVGDVYGHKGKSLVVELTGNKAGLWHDFATGKGGDIFDLWSAVTGKNQFTETIADISKWIGYAREQRTNEMLGQPTSSWNYYGENDQIIATVYRYDTDKGKRYLPFDVKKSSFTAPEIRPLYNIPGILKSDRVVLVEGEKCAETLIEQGITATTAMSGANAPIEKTDWSPLKGKHVIVWPDNDEPGKQYAEKAVKKLSSLGVASLAIIDIPCDKPQGWDSANCTEENISEFIENNSRKIVIKRMLNILDWSVDHYVGPAPEQRFLVEGLFPLGVTSILAAMGDTGKGMLLLDLALKVASNKDQTCGFGPLVTEHGSVVIFSAEDDADEIHRRLERLDPKCDRLKCKDKLFIVPLPSAGGPFAILKSARGKAPETLPKFEDVCKQLSEIENLKLIVFDPLVSFVQADINSDPEVGWQLMGLLASLAHETGASVIVAHHMRKPRGGELISTAEQARDAIRGTTALVDGVRCSFALWPAPIEQQNLVFSKLRIARISNFVYQGAVVKSNGSTDRNVRTYLRASNGLLEDVSEQLEIKTVSDEYLKKVLLQAIEISAREGHPFTHTGGPGVFKQRHRLPTALHEISKHRLERLVQDLLNEKKVIKGMAQDSKEDKWLDVITGPFAKGEGKFQLGAGNFKIADL
ncbi:AAA family ATPase [Wolbachia endosymbiont of Ctenocephalides felis wCfeT]|uniref:AAA family ATPase n=1 Tax=Wolbachia endosymbiont of Ctenocephalides felis wCfeT TaxID=2732593 RepID=UPI001444D87D|nr:AAA family ATPase [Wolbachia endosymbiont of Ctenocephalides felis wCfeT]